MKKEMGLLLLILICSPVIADEYEDMIKAHETYSKLLREDNATHSDYKDYLDARERYLKSTTGDDNSFPYYLMLTVLFGLIVFGAIEYLILGYSARKMYGLTFGIISILIILLSGGATYWQSWAIVFFASLIGHIMGKDRVKSKSLKQ